MTGLAAREHHRFESAGKPYLYLVPSAAIVGLDPAADMVMQILTIGRQTRDQLVNLADDIFTGEEIDEAIQELLTMRAIGPTEISQTPLPKIPAAHTIAVDHHGAQRHEPVQPRVHLLLRVQRGQDRRHRQRQAAEVHDDRDGDAERRVHAEGGGRQRGRPPHLLRRRDADELSGAEGNHRLRTAARRGGRQGGGFQPHDQRDAVASPR